MAQGMNKVSLIGYASKAADVTNGNNGSVISKFQLATSEKYKDHNGKVVEKTEWHNIVAFAKSAEIVRDYVKKGSLLYVEGKLQTSSWDDKASGQKRYKTEIVLRNINFLSARPAGAAAAAGTPAVAEEPEYIEQGDIEIPF